VDICLVHFIASQFPGQKTEGIIFGSGSAIVNAPHWLFWTTTPDCEWAQ
jgi:hypothetical protein